MYFHPRPTTASPNSPTSGLVSVIDPFTSAPILVYSTPTRLADHARSLTYSRSHAPRSRNTYTTQCSSPPSSRSASRPPFRPSRSRPPPRTRSGSRAPARRLSRGRPSTRTRRALPSCWSTRCVAVYILSWRCSHHLTLLCSDALQSSAEGPAKLPRLSDSCPRFGSSPGWR